MAPFATMILAIPALLIEGYGVFEWLSTHSYPWSALVIIFSSGVLAFCLNFSIFYVIHSTTAVTFNVAGNLKVRSIKHILLLQPIILFSFLFGFMDLYSVSSFVYFLRIYLHEIIKKSVIIVS